MNILKFSRNHLCKLVFLFLLLLIIFMLFSGCKNKEGYSIIEGHDGSKYLKELEKSNDKALQKLIKGFDYQDDVKKNITKLQQMTNMDKTLDAAIKASGSSVGSEISGMFGGDDDSDDDSDDDTDKDDDSDDDSDDGILSHIF